MEYGSARWGTHEDITPYIDPVFQNNVILTKTASLTMNSRPKDPKTAKMCIRDSCNGRANSTRPQSERGSLWAMTHGQG